MSTSNFHPGFGFSSKTKQYKIVRHSFVNNNLATLIEIFTFGTSRTSCSRSRNREWTRVTSVPKTLRGHGTYFNGALYWVGGHIHQPSTYAIFRFDLDDEKLEEIYFAQPLRGEVGAFYGLLGVFCGTLYLTFLQDGFSYQVWKMEPDSSSWIKAFCVHVPVVLELLSHPMLEPYYRSSHLQLIEAYEDGKILCLAAGSNLILYDSKTEKTQIIKKRFEEHLMVYQIDSVRFDSLYKILVGDHS